MHRSFLAASLYVAFGSTSAAQAPTVQRDITIGCESCGGAAQFSSIFALAVSASGEILVADRDAPLLRRFDATGKPVWSGGSKGNGPGEYQLIIHTAFLPNGGVAVVDMTTQRVTALGADHKVVSTTQLPRFPTTTGSDFSGNVVVGGESPRGLLDLARWRSGAVSLIPSPVAAGTDADMTARNSSVAVAPSGVIAAFINNERYAIIRIDSSGKRLPDLTRAIERVRRTSEEEAELRARTARMSAMVAAEARRAGGSGGRAVPVIPETERSLKPHAKVDGIRFDPTGRLWVQTMRGDQSNTVFDVFAANGTFAGSVTLPVQVNAFALGGTYLVTAADDADGIPVVTRWRVR